MAISREHLSHIAVGFRYEKAFRISDISGEICDIILHDPSTPFGTNFFPRLNELGTQDKTLVNDNTQNYLKITPSDIILKYNIGSYSSKQNEESDWIKQSAIPFIYEKILNAKNIKNFMRIGVMFGHAVDIDNLGGKIIEKLIDNGTSEADQFSLSFGLKDTAVEGLIKKSVDDYVNKLYIIKQTGPNNFEAIYDFQYYFQPFIKDLRNWNISLFFDRSLIQLDELFYPFINKFINAAVEVGK